MAADRELLNRFAAANTRLESLKGEEQQFRGRVSQVEKSLAEEFGVKTAVQAKALLDKMESECQASREQIEHDIASLEAELDGVEATV